MCHVTDKIHRSSVDLVCALDKEGQKEGETTQTRSTYDLWKSVYDKDGECACDRREILRSSLDLVCVHNNVSLLCDQSRSNVLVILRL